MIKYAKLENGYPHYAPNPIRVDGNYVGNPPGDVYLAEGYKPVRHTEPGETPDGYFWAETWTETDSEIVQGWEAVELPDEVGADEAMEILFGGDGA